MLSKYEIGRRMFRLERPVACTFLLIEIRAEYSFDVIFEGASYEEKTFRGGMFKISLKTNMELENNVALL